MSFLKSHELVEPNPARIYYIIINVDPAAPYDEIKTCYEELVVHMHPDKRPWSPTAIEEYLLLQEAANVLRDPVQRCQYNLFTMGNPAHLMTPMKWWNRYQDCVTLQYERTFHDEWGIIKPEEEEGEDEAGQKAETAAQDADVPERAAQMHHPSSLQLYASTTMKGLSNMMHTSYNTLSVSTGQAAAWVMGLLEAMWKHAVSLTQQK